jgi:arylsulfatase A-like enzyme
MVQAMDHEIGRLFDTLRSMNRLDSTDIIFIGDNGNTKQTAQNTDTSRVKGSIYEYGIHVPLIISGPSVVRPGRTSDALVQAVDLFETIPDLFGLKSKLPSGLITDSRSLLPIVRDHADSIRPWVFSEVFQTPASKDDGKCIKTRNYKLMRFDDGHEELYKLSTDPAERNNLLKATLDVEAAKEYQYLCNELKQLTGIQLNCGQTGISANTLPALPHVYPNPARNSFRVDGIATGTMLHLMDVQGKTVLRFEAGQEQGLGQLATGIYLIRSDAGHCLHLEVLLD